MDKTLWTLRKFDHKYVDMDVNSASLLYNRMLKPIILYVIQIWKTKDNNQVNTLHNEAASLCTSYKRNCDDELMLMELNWFNL